ncbi:MAG: DUF1592 domain-containing protein [Planctomycetota bacterium]
MPFVTDYCVDCHSGGEEAEGGVDLEGYTSLASAEQDRARWSQIRGLIELGAMPPVDALLPEPAERDAVVGAIESLLEKADCGLPASPGRVTIRRLNAFEYDNTVQHLFGIEYWPSLEVGFPSDEVAAGFDNQGDALTLSPILLEKYLDAAEKIAAKALEGGGPHGSRARLLVETPHAQLSVRDAARAVFERLLPLAFRRPAEPNEVQRLVDLTGRMHDGGASFDEAVSAGVQAVLVSPHFLFRVEPEVVHAPGQATEAIGGYQLASRLSYFLWSSMPDLELHRAAGAGELDDEQALRRQVERMLEDERSRSLQKSFVHQWIGVGQLYELEFNVRRYPTWGAHLREAMVSETERFFAAAFAEDMCLEDLVNTDFTFVNPRMAEHYGLEFEGQDPAEMYYTGSGPDREEMLRRQRRREQRYREEDKWIRVELPAGRRGLLTQATVLALTSNPTETSPVKRGKWVLDVLLGDPPPPAPPSVPGLEETAAGAHDLPLREQLELHRSDPNCAACHQQMDPLGLAMQNYDPIGRWRKRENGHPIDASGEVDGVAIDGVDELAEYIRSRREDVARNFVGKLLTFALGRGLEIQDQCAIESILDQTREDGYRLRSVITALVLSDPFRMRSVSESVRTANVSDAAR